uniref:Uncharacterized protein n=1 Tax=Fagus sylvatica TaxID=28930 RepID=A0A2N9J2G8_FAGSY
MDAAVLGMGWGLQSDAKLHGYRYGIVPDTSTSTGLLQSDGGSQFVIILGMRVLQSDGDKAQTDDKDKDTKLKPSDSLR